MKKPTGIQVTSRSGYFVVADAVLDAAAASGLDIYGKMAWVVLCRCAKSDGAITWSQPTMAEMGSMSTRHLRRALKKLEELRVVTVERGRKKRDGSPCPNVYRISTLKQRLTRGGAVPQSARAVPQSGGADPQAAVGLQGVGLQDASHPPEVAGATGSNGHSPKARRADVAAELLAAMEAGRISREEKEEASRILGRAPGLTFAEVVPQAKRELARAAEVRT